jgi:hypothetical protein
MMNMRYIRSMGLPVDLNSLCMEGWEVISTHPRGLVVLQKDHLRITWDSNSRKIVCAE